jgi:voltage-gated potassium channel Kch
LSGSAPASSKANIATLRRHAQLHRYAILLIAELLLILIYPFFGQMVSRDDVFRLCGLIIFAAAFYSVMGRGPIATIALLLGAPALVIRFTNITTHVSHLQLADQILGLLFLSFVTVVLIWRIVTDPSVTTDMLAGAISAYLLIGITFGLAYLLIEHLVPGSFRDTLEPGKHFVPSEFTFFSFVTLTTVGYGDIVPWSPYARSVAMLEAVIGIIYPALLISRLVSLHGRRHDNV